MIDKSNRLSELECTALFDQLFPQGFSADDVVAEIAPEGWELSPLIAVFHPSLDQLYRETVQMQENIQALRRPGDERPIPAAPAREDIATDFRQSPVDTDGEVRDLVGRCIWDVFSDNHDVVAPDGRLVDLGSFRGSGGFLADYLNEQTGEMAYDYMSFYMGTIWVAQRADLTPVYRIIFDRLKKCGCDWNYSFPQIHLFDLRPLRESLDAEQQSDFQGYDPSAALAKQRDELEREQNLAEMRASLHEAHQEALDQARQSAPPATVSAYYSVYGQLPKGWPPA